MEYVTVINNDRFSTSRIETFGVIDLKKMIDGLGHGEYVQRVFSLDFDGNIIDYEIVYDGNMLVLQLPEQSIYTRSNKMDLLTNKICNWAFMQRLNEGSPDKQALKLGEEVGEIFEGIAKSNMEMVIDGIGDNFVALVILALRYNLKIEDCVEYAYNQIKDRKGEMVNGVFVKEGDLNG